MLYHSSSSHSSSSPSSSSHSSSSSLTGFTSIRFWCVLLRQANDALNVLIRHLSRKEAEPYVEKCLSESLFHNFRRQRNCRLPHFTIQIGPTHVWRIVCGSDPSVGVDCDDSHGIVACCYSSVDEFYRQF